ncbi:MAG: MFS transporter [Candidatus Nanoarchaeia archaeon]|nr:MFS transporter [Candidatus Nanoarchaeia archaeon]
MNKIIKTLMFSDLFIMTSFGLIDPILAIFYKENLIGGSIFAAGIASTIFILTKSILQLPFSKYVDKFPYKKKVRWLFMGSILIATVPFIYIFAKNMNIIFAAQFIHGIGMGLAYPTWLGLWSTNLDKKQESYEWTLYSTVTGFGTAFTAAAGAAISEFLGFNYTFILVGLIAITGCLLLLRLRR